MSKAMFLVHALTGACLFAALAACDSKKGPDTAAPDAGDPAAAQAAAKVARGDYLVNVVVGCQGCHTPKVRGLPDPTKKLSGWNCFVRGKLPDGTEPPIGSDATGLDGGAGAWCGPGCEPDYTHYGCLSPSNLTNDATGLKNYTDAQIKEMIAHGKRPNGGAISPIMGYWTYGRLSDEDLDAIVAYLRTVPGIENRLPPADWPWAVKTPARTVPDEKIWKPAPGSPNYDSVMRGRYLATVACMECHTPYKAGSFFGEPFSETPIDEDRLFSGIGFPWSAEVNKIPSPPFPKRIYSRNLTQDPLTGLQGWTPDDIIKAVRDGVAKDGTRVCPPMPTGQLPGGFGHGRLADQDLHDIANYISALPGIVNQRPADCVAPAGPPGGGPGGPPGGPGGPGGPPGGPGGPPGGPGGPPGGPGGPGGPPGGPGGHGGPPGGPGGPPGGPPH